VLVGRVRDGHAQFGHLLLPLPSDASHEEGSRALVLIRPEHVILSHEEPDPDPAVPTVGRGTIIEKNLAGATRRLRLRLPRLETTRQIAPPLSFGEEGLLVDAVLPAEAGIDGPELWVGLRKWHILNEVEPRLLLYDAGAGPTTTLTIGGRLMERLDASATILGVASDPEAGRALNAALKNRQAGADMSHAVRCLRYGHPAEQIACEYAETLYEMVVVAAGHRRQTRPYRLDETVKSVLEMTNAAVLVVKREREAFERMLICTSASETDKSGVRIGGRLAAAWVSP